MSKRLGSFIPESLSASIVERLSPNWQFLISNCLVRHLTLDSRSVGEGSLFFALPGVVANTSSDGRSFIQQAVAKGAVCVLAEANAFSQCEAGGEIDSEVAFEVNGWYEALGTTEKHQVIWVPKLRQWLPEIVNCFYDIRWENIQLLGVTGTNGKTSCTYFLAQLLEEFGCGLMGTLGLGHWQALKSTSNTTADSITTHAEIALMQQQNIKYAAMEVSSHALDQGRLDGLIFDTAVFTNLSRDHLDYHKTLPEYGRTKEKLFEFPKLKRAIFNISDAYVAKACQKAVQALSPSVEVWGYGCQLNPVSYLPKERQIWLMQPISHHEGGMTLQVSIGGRSVMLMVPLVGDFNAENFLCVISVMTALGIAPEVWQGRCAHLQSPPGRMQVFRRDNLPKVVVDFAHTPQALKLVLESMRRNCRGLLWCVFGCGGERDQPKRGLMGKIAVDLANKVVLTTDNSRSESTRRIIADICELLSADELSLIHVEEDRLLAIRLAISQAGPEDWVLIAGKGHERTQEIEGIKKPFHDPTEVQKCFDELSFTPAACPK